MFFKFYNKLINKILGSWERWFYWLWGLVSVGLALGFFAMFSDTAKRVQGDKPPAELTVNSGHHYHLYNELVNLISFEIFDEKTLSDTYERYLWDLIGNAVRLPDSEYEDFIKTVKKVRQVSLLLRFVPFMKDIINAKFPNMDYKDLMGRMITLKDKILTKRDKSTQHLIIDITTLPTHSYQKYLNILDKLHELEQKQPSELSPAKLEIASTQVMKLMDELWKIEQHANKLGESE